MQQYVLWYEQLGMQDVERVGGKNASLGEMISNLSGVGVSVPGGFATTAFAFNEFLELSGLNGKIHDLLDSLDVDDIAALNRAGQQIRDWVVEAPFQPALEQAVREAYDKLSAGLEASFDFPEEDIPSPEKTEILPALEQALNASLARLDATRLGREVGERTTLDLLNAENESATSRLGKRPRIPVARQRGGRITVARWNPRSVCRRYWGRAVGGEGGSLASQRRFHWALAVTRMRH